MDDSAFSLPTLLLIVPVAGALIAMSMGTRRAAAVTSIVTALAQALLIVISAVQLDRFAGDVAPTCANAAATKGSNFVLAQCSTWFEQWGISYSVALGWGALGLVALTTIITLSATMFTWWADRPRPAAMHGLMWLAAASVTGLFVARDLVLFYVFFELMLVPLLVLVGVWGGEQRIRATMTMFIYTLAGSLPMLVGIIGVGIAAHEVLASMGSDASAFSIPVLAQLAATDKLNIPDWTLAAFLLAFVIKAPLFPLHSWLPTAYRQAPVEVTAMLSGLISKAAYFGLLLVVLPLYPGELAGGWGTALTWLALVTLIYGSFCAFRQPDPRGVVAYSSLAQMGLIVLGLSSYLGAGGTQGVAGAYLQTINHGLMSAGLFLLVGIIEQRTGAQTFAQLGGLAKGRARLLTIALVFTMITLAVPGATTFAGELLIIQGAFRGDVSGALVGTIAALAIVLAALYALRLIAAALFTSDDSVVASSAPAHTALGKDLGARELFLVAPALVVLLVLSAWPNALHRAMNEPPVPITLGSEQLPKLEAAEKPTDKKKDHS